MYNMLGMDQAVFQKNLLKELRGKSGNGIEEFIEGFQEYIEEPKRFHRSLLPTKTSPDCESARSGFQESVVKILMGVDTIQPPLMTVLLEKLPEFTGEEDCVILEQGQKVNIPHLLLSQFQWLDHIVNSKEVTEKLLEMVSITCEDVQREIISCLPDIVQDSEHTQVAMALRDLMNENQQLTVTVLDAMSNLILTPVLLLEIRDSVLQSLISVELEDLPVLVKFLLQSVTSADALQVVTELRANLEFDTSTAKKGSGKKRKGSSGDASCSEDVETIILETVKSAVRFQRHVGDALIKAIESVKQPSDHKVIDLFMLLILHGTPRKKVVESLFRNKIRAGCFTEAYIKSIYSVHSQVLKGYFQSLLSLSEVLLRSPELPVSYFGSALYKQTFITLDAYHQQEIVGNLVAHIGSGFEGEIDASLDILAYLVNHHLPKMAPFAILVKSVLDYLDNLSVCQIRKLYFMLSALAFKNPQEGGLIQDDLHIVIRKQLSNNNPKYKRMGVIGAVMIVSCIAQTSNIEESTENSCTQEELSPDLYKQVTSLLTLVRSSSSKSPEAFALFMDELSTIIAQGKLQSKVENWISENLTVDFQENFVVDIADGVPEESGNIPVASVHGLDDERDGGIAINLLPLVVQKYACKTALTAYTESGVTDPLCMSPSVRLLRVCEERQHGTLENIDALLGCPVYLAKEDVYEKFEPLSTREKEIIVSSLFYCINWFVEMVNGFSNQSDAEIKGKVITRLHNITELQKIILSCLPETPNFKPPLANFDLDEAVTPAVSTGTSGKGETKKKAKKGRKTVGKKTDKPSSDSDDNSRDSSQLNNTTMNNTQAATQAADGGGGKDSKPSVCLASYKPFFRELDISVFTILNTGSIKQAMLDSDMNTKGVNELSLEMAQVNFLVEDLCRKLEHSLLASASKRKTFFKVKAEKKVGFSNLDQLTPLEVATKVVKLLPALCNHLEGASGFFQTLLADNDGMMDGPGSHSPQAQMSAMCFQQLLQALLSIFSWNGFQMVENRDLLKEGLGVLVQRIKTAGHSQMSLKDLVKTAVKYISNFANTVPDIGTAVTLLKVLTSLCEKSEDRQLTRKLVPISEEFLKREWIGHDGQREKGSKFNEHLQIIIKSYVVHSEDPLKAVEVIASKAIPELLETDKNGCSATYPTMNRSSYTVYYRVLYSELIEAVKGIPPVKQSDLIDTWIDRLLQWNVGVRIFHILVNLVKTFDGRGNLGTCIKYGRFFVEAFLRLGMPLLDMMFKSHRQDILGLLKNLQQSTRALHHLCGHSKIMKDLALTNNVPMLKRSLEVFVFRVKAMLTVNKCLEAFWMGNLKNRDLQGEEILSQTNVTQDGGDSDGETLPDDDDLSDVELENEGDESNEVGDNDITDPEGSYSQAY
ncbi:Fanconi anemia group D2 protein-like [Ruditapes philippinarum]|uniref:Fanconi anemia group D2 protein-like n=1 Tax=Ruditapes philippinarum TaxID=129788 RepID=UPI00295B6F76|nr:Fanconi anemia group D2 protein-like [Ruditapes philippinarum]